MTSRPTSTLFSRRAVLGSLAASPLVLAASALLQPLPARAAAGAPPALADFQRRMVGDIEVIALADGFAALPTQMMIGLEEEEAKSAARAAHKPHDPEFMSIAVNAYLIRTGDRVIAVDGGAPAAMAPSVGFWAASLALAGIDPAEIDTLFLTHMHADHVGGMTAADGTRALPDAQLVAADAEWTFTHDEQLFATLPADYQRNFLLSRAQLAPYAEGRRLLSMTSETEIAPGVTAVPAPGHTPGHLGLRIASGAESLLIWGDLVHAPAYQFSHPDWAIAFDADVGMAAATRARLLDQVSADGMLVAGMHLDFPALGHVERRGAAYRYVTAPQSYGI